MKDLMEELEISEFLQKDECSKSQTSFSSLFNGWENGNFATLKYFFLPFSWIKENLYVCGHYILWF